MPAAGDVGTNSFTVRVSDPAMNYSEATLQLNVGVKVDVPPVFITHPVTKAQATLNAAYAGSLAADATDADGDPLAFEKLSGAAWLTIGSNGTLGGTPTSAASGLNYFMARVSDGRGGADISPVLIQVGPPAGYPPNNYGALTGYSGDEFIQRVQIADLDKTSGNNGGYGDFRTLIAHLTPGQAVTYTLTPGWTSTKWNEAWTVWIDLNGNGSFNDPGEMVLKIAADQLVHTGTFTIPATATVGLSRMRVCLSYGAPQTSSTGTMSYGEAEDYSVQIGSDPVPNPPPYFLADPVSKPDAIQGAAFTGSLAADAADWENQALTFSKVSGPAWLQVAADGTLTGTPGSGDAGPNSFVVRVTDSLGATNDATLNITVPLTPIQTWQVAQFGANAGNPAIADDLADPDGDGLKNLVEYALGTNPNAADSSGITSDIVNIAGIDHLRLTVNRNPAATDVNMTVETGSDLTGWSSATTFIETSTTNQLIVRDTGSGPRRFIHLKVTR